MAKMRNVYKKCGLKSIGSYHLANLCIHEKIKRVTEKWAVRVYTGFDLSWDRIHCRACVHLLIQLSWGIPWPAV
jgi:tyrosyl-tRNA synthetase